jgi:Transcriptional regulator containing PAS, AAA-type ATPase, and DNA-binding domains
LATSGGAFTGAVEKGRPGKFELADKGTLFLDEISEMPLEMQVNLLRPLEDRCVTRVGGKQSRMVDFRLVTATNRNLDELMASGAFREDLFYRIHVLALEIPPLRERREDIAVIAEYHCKRLCRTYGHPFGGFSAEALRVMEDYDWPGNVRQLVHSVEFAVNMAQGGCILPAHLPAHLQSCAGGTNAASGQLDGQAVAALPGMTDFNLDNQEAKVIRCALKHYNGNMLQAAKALGIGRNTLYAKLRKIDPEA